MASKREEERNEKIIRGLMKLPPNRRCINCNSLGPQYVCANFRTFVCMICSGIHREFTHRVKSVSMSKFTSQEVEALQNGGNQRAREIFLKDWDFERQRLPNSSNVDKVREFIKAVYVDRKYAGGNKCDKPPSDMQESGLGGSDFQQGESNIGDETRRASSYHSYSQSPPYDFQYEDRLKRKQGGPFARKPGSGFHERKAVSFAYSPGRFGDYEDRFANEGSISRGSDYSVSSAGDPFRSGPQSPNLQKDEGFASPTIDSVRGIADVGQCQAASAQPEAYAKRDADRVPLPRPQRSISSGSFSSDGNSVSHHLMAPGSFIDAYSETKQSAGSPHNKTPKFSSFSKVSTENVAALDLFENPSGVPVSNSFPAPSSAPAIDSFQASAPSAAPANDLFQASATSAAATAAVAIDLFQASAPSSVPAIDLFQASAESSAPPQNFHQTSIPSVHQNLPEASDPCGEGWATFDLPQHNASLTNAHDAAVLGKQAEPGISSTNSNSVLTMTSEMQWPDFKSSVVHGPALSVSNPWDEGVQNFQMTVSKPNNKQQWKAFEEGNSQHQFVDLRQGTNVQISQVLAPSTTDQCFGHRILEGSGVGRFEKLPSSEGGSFSSLSSHVASGSSFNQPILPFMTETSLMRQKSVNPFDVDSELETSNGFLDMSNLQAALPAVPVQTPYVDGINESWFSSSPMVPQGGMPYITVPPSSSQLPNVTTHEPVASIGGNPFA